VKVSGRRTENITKATATITQIRLSRAHRAKLDRFEAAPVIILEILLVFM
jgi:hypothetical protein